MPDKFKVAIIGHTGRGDYGHGIDVCWLKIADAEIVGVADAHEGGLAKAKARLSAPKAFADYRKMLDETKPDIVSICTRPPDQHHDMFIAAAERGIWKSTEMRRMLADAGLEISAGKMSGLWTGTPTPTLSVSMRF